MFIWVTSTTPKSPFINRENQLKHFNNTNHTLLVDTNVFYKWHRYSVFSRNNPQPCLDPPKSECHDGQRQINEAEKCIRENTALRTKFRGGVPVQACHAAVWKEFAFGRLGVMTTQASRLAQVGCSVLIGQRACWLMALALESIDSSRAKSDRLHACRDKWQLAATAHTYFIEILGQKLKRKRFFVRL